jgi:crotonobetainyl-CoA:carnitine CoA-transferase CaiB-like acyl-CoA transferase
MKGILDGVRILDLSQFLSGPHATLLMAGMGAEVIRIDNPATGDVLSGAPVFYGTGGPSMEKRDETDLGTTFLKRLRAKKSITIDLKHPEGHALFLKLAAKADVVVENFSVGVTKRLGIDWPRLKAVNPRLVYCSLTGYGSEGPDSARRGYDVTTQAMSGLMSITGQPGGSPTKAGSALGDTISSGFAFAAVLGALYHRERMGIGQFVDVSMVDVLFSLIFDEPLDCYERLGLPYQQGNRVMRFSPFDAYPAQDGWLVIGCGTDAMWQGICRAMARPDLADQADWRRMAWRVSHTKDVDAVIAAWTGQSSVARAVEALTAENVVASPVHTIDDLLKWPHLRARKMIEDVEHPVLGRLPGLKAAGFPLKFSDTATGYHGPAAPTGSHNRDILGALLDLTDEQIADLSGRGVI